MMTTYCTNIHPGESWNEVFSNLREHIPAVKDAVSPDRPFPIGLRLSNRTLRDIDTDASLQFRDWCLQNNCFIPTINGFPYGPFHNLPVKEDVYNPDWRHMERADYTMGLADLLDAWLPAGIAGSVSTVPVGYKKSVDKEDYAAIRKNLTTVLEHLDRLKQKSGKGIILSLEPEPGCVLETTEDAVRFFEEMAFPEDLKEGIGVCFDCCHQAVEFEKPREALDRLREADIKVGKVQVSSALTMVESTVSKREGLKWFCEPCYLHQVVIRHPDGDISRYDDLPEALLNHKGICEEEWRIHFHVPVFAERVDVYGTTGFFTEEVLSLLDGDILREVETYTWHILPPAIQKQTITEAIAREILWVESRENEKNRSY